MIYQKQKNMTKRLLFILLLIITFPVMGLFAFITAFLFIPCFIIYGENEGFEKASKPFTWAISLPFEITGYEPFND